MNRETSVREEPGTGSELATTALRFARRAHHGQRRKQTFEPFVQHPIAVAQLVSAAGCDDRLLAAAYLHDAVERTDVELPEIRERFGPEVAETVHALTDDPSIAGYAERKRDLRRQVLGGGRGAVLIYAADRVANMRDWRTLEPSEREACAERLGTRLDERLELWDEDLAELTRYDSELPFLAEIEIEMRALHAEAP
ncbi:MAG: HD domain-containing protein [Solirubrobacterales bacterium]